MIMAFLLFPASTNATHIVGGDMTYRCLGGDQYEITLTVRRDCFNADPEAIFDDPATLGIFDYAGNLQVGLGQLGRTYVKPTSITTINHSIVEECRVADPGSICVEEAIYRDTIHLPYNKRGYFVAYQRCCRNILLNNIESPLETGATYFVEILANAALECNSQPVYKEWSDIYICINEPFSFDHSAIDPDGDEIVYKLCNPKQGATIDNPLPHLPSRPPYSDVIISSGYSIDNFFGGGDALSIDPNTGVLTATPGITGTFLVGVCMEEYRNGELISIVRRDFEVNVLACTTPITLDCEINTGSLCNGNNTVSMTSQVAGAGSFQWFFDYPNTDPAFTSTAANPTFTYPSPGTYTIRLEATRGADGCTVGKETVVTIGGVAPKAEFTAIPLSCNGDQVTVQFNDSTIGGNSTYTQSWDINGMTFNSSPFVMVFDRDQTITVNYSIVTAEGCESLQNQAVNLEDLINSPYFEVNLVACAPGANTIELINPSGAPTTWTVIDGIGTPITLTGSTVSTTISSSNFEVTMASDNGCNVAPITESYNINDFLDAAIDVQLISCSPNGNTYSFTNTTNANAQWVIQDGGNTMNFSGNFFTAVINSPNFSVTTTFDNSCYGSITNNYNQNSFLQPDFDVELVTCTDNGTIFNFINPAGTVADWTIVDGNTTTTQTGHIISGTITSDLFTVTIDLDNGCSGPYSETFSVEQFKVPPVAEFSVVPVNCTGDQVTVRFINQTISNVNYTQLWTIEGNSFTSSPFELTFDRDQTITVDYEINTTSGCGKSLQNQAINLEDLINSPYFEVDLLSCDASGTLISLVNPSGNPTTWTITDGSNAPINISGSSITTTISSQSFVISMTDNNGCNAGPISQTFNLNDFFDSAVEVQLVSCLPTGNIYSFTNYTNANASWTITGSNGTQTFTGDYFTTLISGSSFTVTTEFDNSCYNTITNTYNADSFLQPNFDVELVACTANGTIFNFVNSSGTVANWTIVDGANTSTDVGHIVSGIITSNTFTVTMDLDNGCSGPYTETFNLDDLLPGLSIANNLSGDCIAPTGETISLSPQYTGINTSAALSYQWTYQVAGAPVQTSNNPTVAITVLPGQQVEASLTVNFANGCSASGSTAFTVSGGSGGDVSITNDVNGPCIASGGQTVTFSATTNGTVSTYSWTYTVSGQATQNASGQSIAVTVLPGQTVNSTVTVTSTDGCVATATNTFLADTAPTPDIRVDEDCSNPDETVVTLTDVTNSGGLTVDLYTWTVGGVAVSNTSTVTFSVIDAPVNVSLLVSYTNGCRSSYNNTFNPEDYTPTLDYTTEAIECIDDMVVVEITYTGFTPECMDISMIEWTINGMQYTGPVVQVTLPINATIDVGLTVTFTNGQVVTATDPGLTTINTGDLINNVTVDIQNNQPGGCSDSLDLEIVNPVPGGDYTWSTDPDFTNVIGTGTTFMGSDIDGFTGTIYTMLNDPSNCTYGTGQITPITNFINLDYDRPFIICAGDTAEFSVQNLDPNQTLTYLWKDENGFIVEGGDTASPVIGIPTDQTDDFFMVLCTENNFGCTSADTISFMISDPTETLDFSWVTDSCGSLTVIFDSGNDFGPGNTMWDFGDGNTSNEEDPTHTYEMEGTYLVTLSNESAVCAGDSISQEITLPDLPTIVLPSDTIMYGPTGPATVTADTSEGDDAVTWCLPDTTIMGNPLVYEPEQDTVLAIAKVVDENGCTNQDSTILIRMFALPPSIMTDAPDRVCAMDTFMLGLDFEGDVDDFAFVWSPEGCILSGGDTPTPTATASETKDFTVLMTHIATGIDTLITVNVDVDNPQVSIFPDNGHPDQAGQPMVCLGSEINLAAEPSDPDCEYEWSTGENGTDITVSPEENTTYTLKCTTSIGCESETSLDIEVVPPTCGTEDVFVPNAFSPNGDGVNDELLVRSKFIKEMEFFVTNRWGQEVWRTENQEEGWNGVFDGKELAPDVYAYCLKVVCVNDASYTVSGNVSILK